MAMTKAEWDAINVKEVHPTTIWTYSARVSLPCDEIGFMSRYVKQEGGKGDRGAFLWSQYPVLITLPAWNGPDACKRARAELLAFQEDESTGIWAKAGMPPGVRPWNPTAHFNGKRITFDFKFIEPWDPKWVINLDLTED